MKHPPARTLSRLATLCVLAAVGCGAGPDRMTPQAAPDPKDDMLGREPLKALLPPAADPGLVAIGRRLFHDKGLSSDSTIACASCHDLARGGVDGRTHSIGVQGKMGVINAPTVFNAALNFVQFWDGRAATLEAQVSDPLTQPMEMNATWDAVLARLRRDPSYATSFAAAFADGVTVDNVSKAIAAFERTLVSYDSPFDRWLRGNADALPRSAQAGYDLFKTLGCVACHQGANVGGNMFARFGVFGDYFSDRGDVTAPDYGRYNVTHDEKDRFVFRVPSLRLAAHTAPYFHDGSAQTLGEAVQVMASYQLGHELADDEVLLVVEFLESLSPTTATVGAP